jgi:hypothetical protein
MAEHWYTVLDHRAEQIHCLEHAEESHEYEETHIAVVETREPTPQEE